ncbi:MAG TPA: class II fructose-bisphosphatase [Longimicrobiales bacterium]|nr:class II fructose-bisphosphatase [Longimicrobiales bacterium]
MRPSIHRNMGMELVRVTEAAALACAPHMGRGDGKAADAAATDAMRAVLSLVDMDGIVVIGEGEKDEAPRLYNGERVGTGDGPALDLAVDPLEGTRLLAGGRTNAVAVIAAAPRGALWNPGPSLYMEKLVVGAEARDAIDLRRTPTQNLQRIAEALHRPVDALTVFVLDKPRHEGLIREIRRAGARVSLHTDGDVMGALLAVVPETGVDVLMGTGGTPEGVIAAVAVKAMGGGMEGRRDPQLASERDALGGAGASGTHGGVLGLDDLVAGEDAFFSVTAVTDSPFLEGVRYDTRHSGVTTESLTIRAGSGSVRYVRGIHQLDPEHIFGDRDPGDAVEAATSG